MKKISLFLLLLLSLVACRKNTWDELSSGFRTPPDSIRIAAYWYWLDNDISKDGVLKDLEAMKSVGITRAFIGNQSTENPVENPVNLFSEEWWDITHAAMKKAGELDIELGMFNCPGWSQSGGPWVTPAQSMKYVEGEFAKAVGNGEEQEISLPDVAEDRIIKVQAYPSVDGTSQTWEFKLTKGQPFDAKLKLDKLFTVRTLTMKSDAVQVAPVSLTSGGEILAEFEFDRHHMGRMTGFKPFAPWVESLPESRYSEYWLEFGEPRDNSTVTLTLSELPAVERFADKTFAKMCQETLPMWDYYMWRTADEASDEKLYVDPSNIIDLTDKIKNGKLLWTVPDGEWTILTSYMQSTGVTNAPAVEEGRGLEVDKMNRNYLAAHYDAFVGELLRRIPAEDRKSLKVVVEDSYETGGQNWTDDMAEAFKETYGYDPIPYLPAIQGVVVGSVDKSDRFLWDLRRLVADRVAYEYVGALRELANKDGLDTWLECYGHFGFPSEFLLYGSQSNQIAGEYWSEGTLGDIENRAASSCGHIYGKNRIWAESCTAAGNYWTRYPKNMKQRIDRFFCEGINATLLHLYIHQPDDRQPGKGAWYGNEFNRNGCWFEGMKSFIQYLRRCNFMLQQGRYVADIAYFIGEDAPKMTGVCDPALPDGYSFDYINADVLKNHAKVRDNKLVLDSGMEYSILVLPQQNTMRPEILECIYGFEQQGMQVLGPLPERSPSLENYPDADARVQELAVLMDPYTIADGVSLETAFYNMGLEPDFQYTGDADIRFIHRTLGEDGDIYFVSNQDDSPAEILPEFWMEPGQTVQIWDPLSGEISSWNGESFKLDALQSVFVIFRKDISESVETKSDSETVDLTASWEVEFAPSAGNPAFTRTFDKLVDWAESDDPQVRYFSGKAVYKSSFTVPAASSARLNLGEVMVVAEVKVNGKEAGGVWTNPYSLDISNLLKEGENTLEITVWNNWRNRLIGDQNLPESLRKTWTNIQPWKAGDKLQASGLLGPVSLQIVR